MNTNALTAQSCSLFEIDAQLEAAFDQMQEEREMSGNISDESRERCVQLFGEFGKKIDRIAAYLRTQQHKGNIAGEEAQRLQQRRRSAEQRVSDEGMLIYFMRCRGLKRLEGELNTIRLQTGSQASLQIDDWKLPQEFCLHTGSIPHRLLKEMLEHLPDGLKEEFLQAMINTQPNTQLVRDALLRGETVNGAKLETQKSHPDRLAWYAPKLAQAFHRKEACLLRLKINRRVRRSVHVKCPRHPRYNPERDGAGAIRGGCRHCVAIYQLYAGKLVVERSLQALEQQIARCAVFNAAAP